MKNRVLKISAFLTLFAVVATLGMFQGCKKSVSPVPHYMPEAKQTVTITVKENIDGKPVLGGVAAAVTYTDGSNEQINIASSGELTLNVKGKPDGELKVAFTKAGYINEDVTVDVEREDENVDWSATTVVLMTEANEPVAVSPTEEKEVEVEESDASVVFPEGCVAEAKEITITETPAAAEVAEESGEVEIVEGKVALKSFDFQPDGLVFEENKPMEITFPIPSGTGDLVLANFEDGKWTERDVVNNGDGTGTATVPHFSAWHLAEKNITWTETKEWSAWITLNGQTNKDFTPNFKKTVTFNVGGKDVSYTFDVDGQEYAARKDHKVQIKVRYQIKTATPSEGAAIKSVTGVVDWSEAEYVFDGHTGGAGN